MEHIDLSVAINPAGYFGRLPVLAGPFAAAVELELLVRLLQMSIDEFRSIADQKLAARGLVVLFGPNSTGKTSVLEAAEHLITQADIRRVDPAERWDVRALGSVAFALPNADVPGLADADTYRWLVCGEYSDARAWDWLGDGTSDRIRGAELGQAREHLAGCLAKSGTAGKQADRRLLARSLLSPSAVSFNVNDAGIFLLVRKSSLSGDAVEAARQIAAMESADDPMRDIAAHLHTHGWGLVAELADGPEVRRRLATAFPPVIVLDGDFESLSGELARSLPRIHDRLWDLHLLPDRGGFQEVDDFLMDTGTTSRESYDPDPWLEGMSEDGAPVVAGPFSPYDQASWHRVRHSVLTVARMIENEANRVAPTFVSSQGTIGVEVIPVSAWGSGPPRIRGTFTDQDRVRRGLNVVGAGTARWAAAAIRLACRRLEAGGQVLTDASQAAASQEEKQQIVRAARQSPLTQTAVRLEPSDASGFYIVDEPEAHLHPAAIRSVRDWLTQLAQTAATVLVATHSPILLDAPPGLTTRVLVLRDENGTRLRTLTGSLASELAEVRETLGLTQGELLLMTRLALYVEGPHDQIILTEWFADELSAVGIRVFPAHGVDNLPALVTSEIITALGVRIATLSDDTSIPRVVSGRPMSHEERAITRLLREAAAAGTELKTIGLSRADILHYLDEEVCQRAAPRFPGWETALAERASSGTRQPWKHWVTSQYGLPLDRDNISNLAAECRRRGKVPAELTSAIQILTAYAAEPEP